MIAGNGYPFVANAHKRWYGVKARKFEPRFDRGGDLTAALDLPKAKRVLQPQECVNVDVPTWMMDSLDRGASKLGVTRQSVIKVWLAERLEAAAYNHRLAAEIQAASDDPWPSLPHEAVMARMDARIARHKAAEAKRA